ncbi:MAG: hypothetical protein AAGI45_05885 [Cyanobacteria bacterium P01_H01_bin.26]
MIDRDVDYLDGDIMPQLQDVAMAPNQLVMFMDYFNRISQRSPAR